MVGSYESCQNAHVRNAEMPMYSNALGEWVCISSTNMHKLMTVNSHISLVQKRLVLETG
jgi:hypothetical protein